MPVEQNYNIYNKELLVIVIVLKKWKVYLKEAKYTIIILFDY
jgi:hypothetical protein